MAQTSLSGKRNRDDGAQRRTQVANLDVDRLRTASRVAWTRRTARLSAPRPPRWPLLAFVVARFDAPDASQHGQLALHGHDVRRSGSAIGHELVRGLDDRRDSDRLGRQRPSRAGLPAAARRHQAVEHDAGRVAGAADAAVAAAESAIRVQAPRRLDAGLATTDASDTADTHPSRPPHGRQSAVVGGPTSIGSEQ